MTANKAGEALDGILDYIRNGALTVNAKEEAEAESLIRALKRHVMRCGDVNEWMPLPKRYEEEGDE